MFCTKCGNKINEKDKFCTKCGTKVSLNDNVEVSTTKSVQPTKENTTNQVGPDSSKTISIVLGIISIVTCCTIVVPIITGIIGLVYAFKARKNDRKFVSGIIVNIVGITVMFISVIASFTFFVFVGLSLEHNLTQDWCCSLSSSSKSCDIIFELEDDHTFTMSDSYGMNETTKSWDYEWLDDNYKGDKYKLTLDNKNYTAYVKNKKMTLYSNDYQNNPILYCTTD